MADSGSREMPPALVQFLLGGQTLVVATVDERGAPMTTLMTWAVARNPSTLTLAVDTRGRSMRNLRSNAKVAIEVLGDDLCYGLRGTAVVEKELMQSPPFPCALVAVRIEEVRDHAAAGIAFRGPSYAFHPGKEHRKGVEESVYAELKGPTPTI
ncbi:MAG TPA: pyridoxamine 5'-phosphate oxidase family protein [Myxococcales bacterium]|nr:pyridoxamine 5'-phosphate oxidase family protein [Myxococcales bacterium]